MSRFMCVFACLLLGLFACGDDSTEADRIGVGAECSTNEDCPPQDGLALECLTQFDGGYCGRVDCSGDVDCPEGSACVTQEEGAQAANYCFRVCRDKPECNENRTEENASNCSSNVVFVDDRGERKACVPPSSGL